MVLSDTEKNILKTMDAAMRSSIQEYRELIVFGSRSRGRSDEESDTDVALIFDVDHISTRMRMKVWDVKWQVLAELDSEEFPLSLFLLTLEDLTSGRTVIAQEIKREGHPWTMTRSAPK